MCFKSFKRYRNFLNPTDIFEWKEEFAIFRAPCCLSCELQMWFKHTNKPNSSCWPSMRFVIHFLVKTASFCIIFFALKPKIKQLRYLRSANYKRWNDMNTPGLEKCWNVAHCTFKLQATGIVLVTYIRWYVQAFDEKFIQHFWKETPVKEEAV